MKRAAPLPRAGRRRARAPRVCARRALQARSRLRPRPSRVAAPAARLDHRADRRAVDWHVARRVPMPLPSIERLGLGAHSRRRFPRAALRARRGRRTRRRANCARSGPIEVARQRQLRMPRACRPTDDVGRAPQQRRDRHVGIGGDRDEGRVGAVLEQAAHEIGEQVAMAADRRIGAAGDAG